MSYSSYRRKFAEEYGVSPGAYRIKVRTEKAIYFLSKGLFQKQIAAELGYSDVYAFSAQFKKSDGGKSRGVLMSG
jgi:AraC-like DNA-binding protein